MSIQCLKQTSPDFLTEPSRNFWYLEKYFFIYFVNLKTKMLFNLPDCLVKNKEEK